LQWKPPADNGGDEIFNYVIEYRSEGTFRWTRANEENLPATYYTIKGLKMEDNYEFRVAAENRAGVGPASEPSASIRPKSPVCK
jgi:titin